MAAYGLGYAHLRPVFHFEFRFLNASGPCSLFLLTIMHMHMNPAEMFVVKENDLH